MHLENVGMKGVDAIRGKRSAVSGRGTTLKILNRQKMPTLN